MIRRFSFADLDRILEIERQAFPKSPYDLATFLNLYWLHPETFWVYVERTHGWEKGQIFAYIVFARDGHIISIAIDPAWRRKGIGKALLERAINHPRIKKLRAEVRVSNKGAQAFYEEMGFQVVRVVSNYYGDEDALIVEKNVQ
ncbi:MAG: GNAT family N-acetyltransferase [Deltaproteobacteria bacterium]